MKRIAGFTLIEILIVVAIIGVLTALLIPNFLNIRMRARDAQLKSKMGQFKTALRAYYNDNRQYPDTGGTHNAIAITGPSSIYMKERMSELKYYNLAFSGSGTYENVIACVTLENTGDKDIAQSLNYCFNGSPDAAHLASYGCPVERCYCVCTF